jgi:hypothetical protein
MYARPPSPISVQALCRANCGWMCWWLGVGSSGWCHHLCLDRLPGKHCHMQGLCYAEQIQGRRNTRCRARGGGPAGPGHPHPHPHPRWQIDQSQELVAIGTANMVSSLFQSYPITGSFSRTAVNSASGWLALKPRSKWTGASDLHGGAGASQAL